MRPQNRRVEYLLVFVQQHRRAGGFVEGQGGFEGSAPVLRILIAPAHVGIMCGILTAGGGGNDVLPAEQRQGGEVRIQLLCQHWYEVSHSDCGGDKGNCATPYPQRDISPPICLWHSAWRKCQEGACCKRIRGC